MSSIRRNWVIPCLVLPTALWGCASHARAEDESSQRISELEAENAALVKQVDTLKKQLDVLTTSPSVTVPVCPAFPPIAAVVLSVNRDLGLVVLNRGKEDGVKESYVFTIYRGSLFKGQVRVMNVQEGVCSGLITSEKALIAPGDSATTSL